MSYVENFRSEMEKDRGNPDPRSTARLGFVLDLLFAIAIAVSSVSLMTRWAAPRSASHLFLALRYWIDSRFFHAHDETGATVAFFVFCAVWTACFLLLLRQAKRLQWLRRYLVSITVLIPLFGWIVPPGPHMLYVAETGLVLVFAILLARKRMLFSFWAADAVFAGHYLFWSTLFWRDIPNPIVLLVPGTAAVATLTWVSWMVRSRE